LRVIKKRRRVDVEFRNWDFGFNVRFSNVQGLGFRVLLFFFITLKPRVE